MGGCEGRSEGGRECWEVSYLAGPARLVKVNEGAVEKLVHVCPPSLPPSLLPPYSLILTVFPPSLPPSLPPSVPPSYQGSRHCLLQAIRLGSQQSRTVVSNPLQGTPSFLSLPPSLPPSLVSLRPFFPLSVPRFPPSFSSCPFLCF